MLCLLLASAGAGTIGSYVTIEAHATGKTAIGLFKVPSNEVPLIPRSSNRPLGGQHNLYFTGSISTPYNLLQAGTIRYVLACGDNGSRYNLEPTNMRGALPACRGIISCSTTPCVAPSNR